MMRAVLFAAVAHTATATIQNYVGQSIALYNVAQQRFVRMAPIDSQFPGANTCTDMGRSGVIVDPEALPSSWLWEKFIVVDGGNGTFGFWNAFHKRFVRMPPALGHLDVSIVVRDAQLPEPWRWERFQVVRALGTEDEFGLWNPTHERFVSMSADADYLESSAKHVAPNAANVEERFRVVVVPASAAEGALPALPQEPTCPRWPPNVIAVIVCCGVVTVGAVALALGAVMWALKSQSSGIAKLTPLVHLVEPLAPQDVNAREQRGAPGPGAELGALSARIREAHSPRPLVV